jgi:Tol biopolymer transport system component
MCERKMDERREIWVGEWMQNCDLWSIDPDGSSARLILDGGDEVHLLFASWSPDGQTLAFHQCDTTKREYPLQLGHCSLGLVKRDGSDPMVILDTVPTKAREIKWHPDGSRLLLIGSSANVNTVPVVWSVRPDGTDLRPIINDAGNVKVLCEP